MGHAANRVTLGCVALSIRASLDAGLNHSALWYTIGIESLPAAQWIVGL